MAIGTPFNLPTQPYAPGIGSGMPIGPVSIGPMQTPPEILQALTLVQGITPDTGDVAYLQRMGVDMIFNNGAEAMDLFRQKGVHFTFSDFGTGTHHAEYDAPTNTIRVNQKYRGDTSPATMAAIASALYHEAGHLARAGDGQSSLQEEINSLALNVLAHRYFQRVFPTLAWSASNSPLINDGVALYDRLFFDPDPNKTALVNRVIEKYGDLPPETPDHRLPEIPIAYRVMQERQRRQQAQALAMQQQPVYYPGMPLPTRAYPS